MDQWVTVYLWLTPLQVPTEPWRVVTTGFVHDPNSPVHLLLNMYGVFIFGRVLEPMLGKFRFIALYLLSIAGGSIMVLWLSDIFQPVLGASGAFFGLMAAYFVAIRSMGGNPIQVLILLGFNLALGFLIPNISWQGHLGGLLVGGAVASVYAQNRGKEDSLSFRIQLAGIAVILALAGLLAAQLRLFPLG